MCIKHVYFSVGIGRHGVGIAVGIVISLISLGFIIIVTVIIITKYRIGKCALQLY